MLHGVMRQNNKDTENGNMFHGNAALDNVICIQS
jgi:hypothetical protein